MKTMWLPLTVLCCAHLLGHAGEPAKDLEAMQGSWLVESMVERGKKPAAEELKTLEVTIKADLLTVKENGKVVDEFKLKLDPAKKPKSLDLIYIDKSGKKPDIGIYDLDGDRLRICIDVEGKERPGEFASTEKSTHSLIVLKRKKQ